MAKRKTLPKDFDALLEKGDIDAIKAALQNCEANARGGYSKKTALAFNELPDEVVHWLVERGADINAQDSYGETPLYARAGHWKGSLQVLLELGADQTLIGSGSRGTPLHAATKVGHVDNVRLLLAHGADINARNREGATPLEYALQQCSNIDITRVVAVAPVLLAAGALKTERMAEYVTRIGSNFEFHRAGFNPESVDEFSDALDQLYIVFGVEPVARRVMHDGRSPVVVKSTGWQDQHQELWEMLVPSKGPAATVQGEVIRLSGRIRRELDLNGGINWDADFRKMADALLVHLESGKAVPDTGLARQLIADAKRQEGESLPLCELAVIWVLQNPEPLALEKPAYKR